MPTGIGRLFLGLALFAATAAGAEEPVAAAFARDVVARDLAELERRALRVRQDVEAAQARLQAPLPLATDVGRLRKAAKALERRLYGQPAAVVMPLLRRLDRLGKTLTEVEGRIAEEPRRVLRPARVGAPSGSGVITGRLTDARTGAPIEDYVEVWAADGQFVDYGFAEGGVYTVEFLASGTYFVVTDTFEYVNELFDNIPCDLDCEVTTGTPVQVIDGQVTGGINFVLVPLSVIQGTILDAATLQPITEAALRLMDAEGHFQGSALSGPDGQYRINRVHPGVYYLHVEHRGYLDELYDNVPCQPTCSTTAGTPIPVSLGADVSGIDFRLQLGGSISGRVTDAGTGEPLTVTLDLYDAGGGFVDSIFPEADGRFQRFDLTTGTYFVLTRSSTHANELYDNLPCPVSCVPTQGTPIAVTVGQERSGVDFALVRLGAIAGRVTTAAGQGLLADVRVFNAQGSFVNSAFSDVTGAYRAGGLMAGNYFAVAASSGYLGELYDNLPCHQSCTPTSGTPIPVVLGGTATGIDFRLERGGSITGTVSRQAGGPVATLVDVTVFNASGGVVDTAFISGGSFLVDELPAGTYYAMARAVFGDFLSELYREITCNPTCPPPTSGTAIAVALGQVTGGVDFTLTRLGHISGRVRDAGTGLPIDTQVQLFDNAGQLRSTTGTFPLGSYTFESVQPGSYFVKTNSSEPNIVDELYDNRTCEPSCTVTTGTPVAAALDTTTSGIDFALRQTVFVDVPVTHFAWRHIEAVYNAGVTSGCATAPRRYCPDSSVTRAQMAVFLLRAKEGPAYLPPPATGVFQDVPANDPFARWIEELARRQITGGCSASPPLYCPGQPTTRAQMSTLLLVTKEGTGYQPPPATGVFQDVPASDPFAKWIEELVRRQIAGGCSTQPPLFCPGQATSRAQMAVFLATTFTLPLP